MLKNSFKPDFKTILKKYIGVFTLGVVGLQITEIFPVSHSSGLFTNILDTGQVHRESLTLSSSAIHPI